jgi:predicted N-acetyltransferase YhbS
MSLFTIEPIAKRDIEAVARIMSSRWQEPIDWCREETQKYLAQNEISAGFCVHSDGRVVGTGLFSLHNEDVSTSYGPWLYLLWVEPEFRGYSIGIELTRKRMEHARKFEYMEIYLDTMDAAPYHQALGWEDVCTVGRKGENLLVMRWNLLKEFPVLTSR